MLVSAAVGTVPLPTLRLYPSPCHAPPPHLSLSLAMSTLLRCCVPRCCLLLCVQIECTTLTPYPVLKASGHVDKFEDLMVKVSRCWASFVCE